MVHKLTLIILFIFSLQLHAQEKSILVLADSLSASYGIPIEQGWVALLQKRLNDQGYVYNVFNASISGDTTHGARSRLNGILDTMEPDITIVELGGNDGLRGLPINEIKNNLDEIINRLLAQDSHVLLLPMLIPPNYGKFYIDKFSATYKELAVLHDIILGRFILDGIADKPELMQNDGIHPKPEAQKIMLDNVWPDLEPLLDRS
jgi:acyl-CoA thioesterase I